MKDGPSSVKGSVPIPMMALSCRRLHPIGPVNCVNGSTAISSHWAADSSGQPGSAGNPVAASFTQLQCPVSANNTTCAASTLYSSGWEAYQDEAGNPYWDFGTAADRQQPAEDLQRSKLGLSAASSERRLLHSSHRRQLLLGVVDLVVIGPLPRFAAAESVSKLSRMWPLGIEGQGSVALDCPVSAREPGRCLARQLQSIAAMEHHNTARKASKTSPIDALSVLTKQHRSAKELLDELASTTDRGIKKRQGLLSKLATELTHHMTLEEEIFYPAFKDAVERKRDKNHYYEAKEEHHVAKKVLKDLVRADPATPAFGGKASVLKELVEHHVAEEESEMFPIAKEVFTKEQLQELGERMLARQEQLENGRAWDRANAAASH